MGHKPVDLGAPQPHQPGLGVPGQQPPLPGQPPVLGQPAGQPLAVEKDTTVELYLWEELLLFMAFHLVGLVFCIQPALSHRKHTAVGIVIAWLHLPLICGYTFVAVG